jgi:hypothetical protein
LKVYNVLGQEVATLIHSREMDEGMHEVEFNASRFASGIYFYRFTAQSEEKTFVSVKKLVVVK